MMVECCDEDSVFKWNGSEKEYRSKGNMVDEATLVRLTASDEAFT